MIIYKHEYSPYSGKIATYEVNVEEKPKTYVVIGKCKGVWESRVSKDAIGVLDGNYKVKTFSLSADTADFVKMLIARAENKISRFETEIQKAQIEKEELLKLL